MPKLNRSLCALAAAALLSVNGCTGAGDSGGEGQPSLLVLAAASLNTAMPALVERFEAEAGVEIDVVLGSTGNLAAQIQAGAPADLFFSADEETVQRLARAGAVAGDAIRTYAVGELVLIWRQGAPPPAGLQSLGAPEYRTIAIANPEHAPYGAAAREALSSVDLWQALQSRLVYGETVAQAYQLVRTGNADVGIVARSVLPPGEGDPFLPVDASLHSVLRQSAAVLSRSSHPAAGQFLDFVLSPVGQSILSQHGFRPAPDR